MAVMLSRGEVAVMLFLDRENSGDAVFRVDSGAVRLPCRRVHVWHQCGCVDALGAGGSHGSDALRTGGSDALPRGIDWQNSGNAVFQVDLRGSGAPGNDGCARPRWIGFDVTSHQCGPDQVDVLLIGPRPHQKGCVRGGDARLHSGVCSLGVMKIARCGGALRALIGVRGSEARGVFFMISLVVVVGWVRLTSW